ncbi:sodium/proline symporter PutP [Sphingorhabdus sp. Alg239-R122]|uniref:sodium/proline symporter PutP n=1 Tax=Sphingorhabdus sp. Alg239-R122 TaxID=2305989 RepID=UPI0013D92357|nr:sodium/proline symporter PutP [Sphingorhabdus sp. Alg239-R122]
MQTGIYISLALYFIAMLGIGLYAWKKSTDDVSGYMLGGRNLPPAVAALSAGASDMSGWLMLGLPGAMFASGMSSSWIAIGLFIGAFLNWIIVAPRLRQQTQDYDDALTIPDFFEKRFADNSHLLRVIASVVIIIFFTLYTSSGLVAGGKLFESAFGQSYETGLWVTAGVVLAYTMFGGFLAVSLTDFVQGCIMFVALILVPVVALTSSGGFAGTVDTIRSINPDLLSLFTGTTIIGIISAMSWGLGYFGQPHIIVRFMAVRSVADVPAARNIGMGWMFVTLLGALAMGLTGLAYATQNNIAVEDPETIFMILADLLFHPLITGFLLAAILAAIMSTISSQLLVSSSSLTEDFYKLFVHRDASQKELVTVGRFSVLAVALFAIFLAYNPENSVLGLVSNAWAGFGAAFGPLVILSLTWKGMTRGGALAGMVVGAVTVLLWINMGWSSWLYEIVPGFVLSLLTIVIVSLMNHGPEN